MSYPRIDYTKRRLGSRTNRGRKIEKCPTCGRKGEMIRSTTPTARSTLIWSCTHLADDWGWATATFDGCSGRIVDGVAVPAKPKAASK